MTYTGQCVCGAVQLRLSEKPSLVAECWCSTCQRYGGGGSTVNALCNDVDVAVTGNLAWHSYIADNGNKVDTGFCPSCGTHVIARTTGRENCTIVRVGTLNQPHDVIPQFSAFTNEAPEWPDLERRP